MTSAATGPLYVDTHAHLDEPAFDRDRDEVVARARAAGVVRIVNVGYRPLRWDTSADLAARHPTVSHMLGLHPHHADEFTDRTCQDLAARIAATRAVAVGEIGLDYFRDGPDAATQQRVFAAQLGLAIELNLPVVIHQRAAEPDLMTVLGRFPALPRVVLHSFDGTDRLADFGTEQHYRFGVGGLMTRAGNDALRHTISRLPISSILLETDAPYLVPAGAKDRRNVPANVPLIASKLAELLRLPVADVAAATTANANAVFSFPTEAEA